MHKKSDWLSKAIFAAWWFEEDDLKADSSRFEKRAKELVSEGINAVITFGYHFRWDWVERLEEVEVMYKKMINACHKYSIKVCEHHSSSLVSRPKNAEDLEKIKTKYPHHNTGGKIYSTDDEVFFEGKKLNDWYQIDAKTNAFAESNYVGYIFCPNNPDYQKAYLRLVQRLINLGIDSLMSDDMEYFAVTSCVCEHCKNLFRERYKAEIPSYPDDTFWNNYSNPDFRNYLKFRVESVANHYKRLKEMDSAVPLFHCCTRSSCASNAQIFGISYADTGRYCALTFQEVCESNIPYHSYLRIGAETHLNNAVRRYHNMVDALILMYPYTDEEYYINWAYAKSYNQKLWNCPGAQKDKKWDVELPLWKTALKFEKEHPELFEKKDYYTEIGILFPRRSRLIYGGTSDDFVTNEYCGFCEIFMDNNIMFDTILEEELLGSLSKYKVLILPNAACLSDKEIEAIRSFVSNGGRIIATFETGQYDENGKLRDKNKLLQTLNIIPSGKITTADFEKGKVTYLNYKPGIKCCSPFYYLHPKSKETIVYKDESVQEEKNTILDCLNKIMPEGLCVDIEAEKGVTTSVFEYKENNSTRYVIHIVNRKGALLANGSILSRKFSEKIHYPELTKNIKIKIKSSCPLKTALLFDPTDESKSCELTVKKDDKSFTVDISKDNIGRYKITELKC